jgi:transposase InsO family protein
LRQWKRGRGVESWLRKSAQDAKWSFWLTAGRWARESWEAAFCVETREDALARHTKPDISNTDQGSQFIGQAFTSVLADNGIAISMDGKGA